MVIRIIREALNKAYNHTPDNSEEQAGIKAFAEAISDFRVKAGLVNPDKTTENSIVMKTAKSRYSDPNCDAPQMLIEALRGIKIEDQQAFKEKWQKSTWGKMELDKATDKYLNHKSDGTETNEDERAAIKKMLKLIKRDNENYVEKGFPVLAPVVVHPEINLLKTAASEYWKIEKNEHDNNGVKTNWAETTGKKPPNQPEIKR